MNRVILGKILVVILAFWIVIALIYSRRANFRGISERHCRVVVICCLLWCYLSLAVMVGMEASRLLF